MKKQLNYQKNSFILFETILSILILSIIISSFSKLTYNNSSHIRYKEILNIHNNFNERNYKDYFSQNNEEISIIINTSIEKTIFRKKILYKNKDLRLYTYEN